jgi:hypothetical protein
MNINIALLWDIENVTPSSSNNLFIQGLWDYAESLGRVAVAYAYADWSKPGFRNLGPSLAEYNCTMVHIPYKKTRKNKNGSDMQLVSDTMDLLHNYDHISTYLLITGDSDFRPLLRSLRKSGKEVHIVCDFKTAAQDLLNQADSFKDYRELMPDNDNDNDIEEEEQQRRKPEVSYSKEYWYERLAEAANLLHRDKKTCNMGTCKIKMKMLNRSFDEKKLGVRPWSAFIGAAVKAGFITMEKTERDTEIVPGKGYRQDRGSLQLAFKKLHEILTVLDGRKEAEFHPYSIVSLRLKEGGIDLDALGFTKFKLFASSAEARGLVETKIEDFSSYIRNTIIPPSNT